MPRATCLLALASALAAEPAAKVDFLRDVKPILAQKCFGCHGAGAQQAGLRLDRRQNAMRGGDYGPVIVAGNSGASKLIKRIVNGDGGLQMPPTGALPADEIATLKAWIDQGADYVLEVKDEAPPKPVDPRLAALISAVRSNGLVATVPSDLLNAGDAAGSTLLHHAAGFGSVATLQRLLDAGADVTAKNARRATPLMWAIRDEAKVRLLLARGADVTPRQADGRTALLMAASLGNGRAIVEQLLAKGASVSVAAASGQTPLMAAAARGNTDIIELLLGKKPDVNARAGNGATALIAAAASGQPASVKLLLAAGADPNIVSKKKDSALGEAATAGVEESVRLLLDAGAKVNVPDDRGYSPLMYAAASDSQPIGIVRLLLAKGADPHQTGEGETARTLAAKRGDTEVARLLASTRTISEAVEKATALLAKQSENFIRIGGCNSCHGQDLASAAAALARNRGINAPKVIAQLSEPMRGASADRVMDLTSIGPGSVAWELFDFGMNRVPRSDYTDSVIHYLKAMQTADGHWRTAEGRRPPMSSGEFQTAALSIYSLRHYSPDPADAEIARASAWLQKAVPRNTQDRAFQVLGLAWAKADAAAIERSARALATTQHADGGWGQLPGMDSDAYATGEALYALSMVSTKSTAYEKGVNYLLRTQAHDGSWHVKTRSIWFQPYFESGFPYAHDQWISVAGTAWASMALSMAHEAPALSRR